MCTRLCRCRPDRVPQCAIPLYHVSSMAGIKAPRADNGPRKSRLRLLGNRMVRATQEHLRGQVPALLTTKWAGDHNGLEREFLHPGGDIPATVFAVDDELLAFLHHKPHDKSSNGEVMTKAYTREPGESAGGLEHSAIWCCRPLSVLVTANLSVHDGGPSTNLAWCRS